MNDLRKELDCRSLSSKGLKSQLIARLTKQLKVEEQVEEAKEPEKPEVKVPDEEEPPQEEDKEVGPGGLFFNVGRKMSIHIRKKKLKSE